MKINNNTSALKTYNIYQRNTNKTSKIMEKLSSGFRINKADDDAAGLSISEKMRSQIRGLNRALKNIQDGISFIQVSDGGLNNIKNPPILRLHELAVKAANDTLSTSDRNTIQQEVDQICNEITKIVEVTQFNKQQAIEDDYSRKSIVNGSVNLSAGVSIITGYNDNLQFSVDDVDYQITLDPGTYSADDLEFMFNDKLWEIDPLFFAEMINGRLKLTAYGKDTFDNFSGNAVSLLYDINLGSGANLIGTSIFNGGITIEDKNNTLNFSYDSVSEQIELTIGDYTQDEICEEIRSKLVDAGVEDVSVSINENKNLVISSAYHSITGLYGDMI